MMHELFRRLAQYGGETSLYLLFLMSIVAVAVILERSWTYFRSYVNASKLLSGLEAALRSGNLPLARSLVVGSPCSLKRIAAAGLSDPMARPHEVRDALQQAKSAELLRLRAKLSLLPELAKFATLIGLTGTLLDLLSLSTPTGVDFLSSTVRSSHPTSLVMTTLVPAVAGLFVAIPSWLATSVLGSVYQRFLRDADELSHELAQQLTSFASPPASIVHTNHQAA